MRSYPSLVLFLLFVTFTLPTFARNFRVVGSIEQDYMHDLRADIENSLSAGDKVVRIELNSIGGDLPAAIETFEYLRGLSAQGVSVITVVREECSSSCTVLFAAGQKRMALSSATFLFHRVEVSGTASPANLARARVEYASRWLETIAWADSKLAQDLSYWHIFTKLHGSYETTARRLVRGGYSYVTDLL